MNISFGKKIPIYQNSVYDRQKSSFVPATLFELDCNDESDMEYLAYKPGAWEYKYQMTADLFSKQNKLQVKNSLSEFEKLMLDNNKFYTYESEDGTLIGICETDGFMDLTNIHYLETNPDKRYKYAGQSILASIAKRILGKSDNPVLMVNDPAVKATRFYTDKCGFKTVDGSRKLQMDKSSMSDFIKNVENKTRHKILNITI